MDKEELYEGLSQDVTDWGILLIICFITLCVIFYNNNQRLN